MRIIRKTAAQTVNYIFSKLVIMQAETQSPDTKLLALKRSQA
jgi:hypothetical protein